MQFASNTQEQVRLIDSSLRRTGLLGTSLAKLPSRQPATAISCDSRSSSRPADMGAVERAGASGFALASAQASNLAIRQQLTHMLQSKIFVQSDKLSRFLSFIVEHVIDGNQSCLKEYVIGSEVYDRKPPYHPSQDSIVRTEARRLRSKLKEYYEFEGKEDPIFLYLRPGSYIPVFHAREDLIGTQAPASSEESHLDSGSLVRVAVLPFKDISENLISSTYARGIPDELAYLLMLDDRCSVIPDFAIPSRELQERGTSIAMSRLGARIAYVGTVRGEGTRLRVTARIVDAAGCQLWMKRLDVEVKSQASFAIEEEIAVALSAGVDALFGQPRQLSIPAQT